MTSLQAVPVLLSNNHALSMLIQTEVRSKYKSFFAWERATHSACPPTDLWRGRTENTRLKGPSLTASPPAPPREKGRAVCWC